MPPSDQANRAAEANASLPASDGSAIPRALFSCSNECCAEEVSYHADELYWYSQDNRWVCENCWCDLSYITEEDGRPGRGITLADHIIAGSFNAMVLLQKPTLTGGQKPKS
jgi:hypothetical protein